MAVDVVKVRALLIRVMLSFVETWAFTVSSIGALEPAPFVVNVLNPVYINKQGGRLDMEEVEVLIRNI